MSMKNTTLDDLYLLESELFESDDVEDVEVTDTDVDSDELEESLFGLDLNLDLMLESDDADDDDDEGKDDDDEESEKLQEATFAAALLLDTASREDISQIAESYEDMGIMVECFGPVMEKVIVRLDRKARLNHLQKAAVFKLAAQAKDTKYRKLVTLWKMERQIEQYLAKKYGSKAAKVAREQIKNYTATGIKKVKSDPAKEVGKGRVANKVASKAINQAKASFSQPKK